MAINVNEGYEIRDRIVSTKIAEMLAEDQYGAQSGPLFFGADTSDTVLDYKFLLEQHGMKKFKGNFASRAQLEKRITYRTEEFYDSIAIRLRELKKPKSSMFQINATSMPRQVPRFIDAQNAALLVEGGPAFTTLSFDEKPYFSKTHPRFSDKGAAQSNLDDAGGGAGYWYLFDTRILPPILWHWFKRPESDKFGPETEWARQNQQVIWRLMADCGFGLGLWYYGYASNKPLTEANLQAAKVAMEGIKADAKTDGKDQIMGVKPTLLVTGSANDLARRKLMNATNVQVAGGGNEDNVMRGAFESMTFTYLP